MTSRQSTVVCRQSEGELLAAFEAGIEPDGGFHHADHVHVAWWYLTKMSRPGATRRFTAALKHYTTSQGKPERYDEALTLAYLQAIGDRIATSGPGATWSDFAAANADLLEWPAVNMAPSAAS